MALDSGLPISFSFKFVVEGEFDAAGEKPSVPMEPEVIPEEADEVAVRERQTSLMSLSSKSRQMGMI